MRVCNASEARAMPINTGETRWAFRLETKSCCVPKSAKASVRSASVKSSLLAMSSYNSCHHSSIRGTASFHLSIISDSVTFTSFAASRIACMADCARRFAVRVSNASILALASAATLSASALTFSASALTLSASASASAAASGSKTTPRSWSSVGASRKSWGFCAMNPCAFCGPGVNAPYKFRASLSALVRSLSSSFARLNVSRPAAFSSSIRRS